jgi:hypothetical protein
MSVYSLSLVLLFFFWFFSPTLPPPPQIETVPPGLKEYYRMGGQLFGVYQPFLLGVGRLSLLLCSSEETVSKKILYKNKT